MFAPLVVSFAQVLFQPDVKADEKVAAAQFSYFQLSGTSAPVTPGNWERGPTEPAHDRLEWYFHRDVEMRCDQWPASFDHFPAIAFKGVGRIVEFHVEQNFKEDICEPIQNQLDLRIVDCAPAFDEPAPKNAIVTLV